MLWSKFIPAHQPELSGRLGAYDFTRPLVLTFEVPGAVARFDSGFARREGAAGEWLVAHIDGEVWEAERQPAPLTNEDR